MELDQHQHQQPMDDETAEEATADEETTHHHITDEEEEEEEVVTTEAQRASSYFQDEKEEDNDTPLEAKESEAPISYAEAVEETDRRKSETALDRSSSTDDRLLQLQQLEQQQQQQQQQQLEPSSVSPAVAERESFSARYLGSVRLPEGELMGDKGLGSMTKCIANVTSKKSKSNKVIYELKENKKVNLVLEGREMKVIGDDKDAKVILCHPLNKIRAWAVGRETDSRHFAYVIRSADDAAGYWFVCRVFKCSAEARHVTSALRSICQRRADARAALKKKL